MRVCVYNWIGKHSQSRENYRRSSPRGLNYTVSFDSLSLSKRFALVKNMDFASANDEAAHYKSHDEISRQIPSYPNHSIIVAYSGVWNIALAGNKEYVEDFGYRLENHENMNRFSS